MKSDYWLRKRGQIVGESITESQQKKQKETNPQKRLHALNKKVNYLSRGCNLAFLHTLFVTAIAGNFSSVADFKIKSESHRERIYLPATLIEQNKFHLSSRRPEM